MHIRSTHIWIRLLATGALWAGYSFGYGDIFRVLGSETAIASLTLVAATAWLWGAWVGLVAGLGVFFASDALAAQVLGLEGRTESNRVFQQLSLLATGGGVGYFRSLHRQLTHHKQASDMAQYDALTGLLNRTAFEQKLSLALEEAREKTTLLAVLFVDLDRFKAVNDTFGHEMGDELLKSIARTLRANVRQQDLVARLGGDEFTIALTNLRERESAAAIAKKLVEMLNSPFEIDGKVLSISASVGIAIYPRDGEDVETLTQSADNAMYQVKEAGKNAFNFSTMEARNQKTRRVELERALRTALENDELELRYQPQIDLATNRLCGLETLVRWRNKELGLISPQEFIPIAEEAGLIVPIGHWLLRQACFQMKEWIDKGYRPIKVSVNVSSLQFAQSSFLGHVQGALQDSGLDPNLLEIEVTESVLVREPEMALRIFRKLARMGVHVALDDFGTGYSSLSYLQSLPIGTLKIDRSFIRALVSPSQRISNSTTPIVEAICAMALKLGKGIIAEGIETHEQRDYLKKIGCQTGQGFLFSKPARPPEIERLLATVAGPPPARDPEADRLLVLE